MRCVARLPPPLERRDEGDPPKPIADLYAALVASRSRCWKLSSEFRDTAEDMLLHLTPLIEESLETAKDCDEPAHMVNVVFQPGSLGLELAERSGLVVAVHTGLQAAAAGIAEGWCLKAINDIPFTQGLLKRCAMGTEPYMGTFEYHRASNHIVPDEERASAKIALTIRHENASALRQEWEVLYSEVCRSSTASLEVVQGWCDAWNNAKTPAPIFSEVEVCPLLLSELCDLRKDQEEFEVCFASLRARLAERQSSLVSAIAASEHLASKDLEIETALRSESCRSASKLAVGTSKSLAEQIEVGARELRRQLDSSICELDLRNIMLLLRDGENAFTEAGGNKVGAHSGRILTTAGMPLTKVINALQQDRQDEHRITRCEGGASGWSADRSPVRPRSGNLQQPPQHRQAPADSDKLDIREVMRLLKADRHASAAALP